MKNIVRAGITGLLLALAATPALAAPTVSFRVEGQNATLLARTQITLLDAPEPRTGCPGDSAAAAIEVGTQGNWDGSTFTQTILGETHKFDNNDYWGFWVWRDGRFQSTGGICDEKLATGEELLAAYNVADANFDPEITPLALEDVPVVAKPGEPFTVTVVEYQCEHQYCPAGDGRRAPVSGATVTAAGASAITDASGHATLTLSQGGATGLRATRPNNTPSATEPTCVTNGSDGFCGTSVPAAPAACVHDGDDGRCGTRDRTAPLGWITGIGEGRRFTTGPRELTGTVDPDPSGLGLVKLRLTRRHHGHCQYYSATRGRFRNVHCGVGSAFKIGTSATWSYLLPKPLGPGRYVLDVIAIDGAFNRDVLARGRSRVVFTVG